MDLLMNRQVRLARPRSKQLFLNNYPMGYREYAVKKKGKEYEPV
jgi:hypothetical protein